MAAERVQDAGPFAGHSPQQERPLGGYAVLMAGFGAMVGAFAAWLRASDREFPERIGASDLALITVATHKSSRLIAKDRVSSTIREEARGTGLRRAVGELVVCPYCLGLWIAAGLSAALVVAPRPTRWAMSVLTALFGSDVMHIAYKKAEDTL
jgi:hypothetical protein